MCDPKVWVHLLNGTAAFPSEKIEELVNLAGKKRNLKMMVELLASAARKFSGPRKSDKPQVEIVWAVRGSWSLVSTNLELQSNRYNNVEEFFNVAKAVGVINDLRILRVKCYEPDFAACRPTLKIVLNHVEQQGRKLSYLRLPSVDLCSRPVKELFSSLLRVTKKWWVWRLDLGWDLACDDIADMPVDGGHIVRLFVFKRKKQLNLDLLRRVWEIATQMSFRGPYVHSHNEIRSEGAEGQTKEKAPGRMWLTRSILECEKLVIYMEIN